MTKYIINGGRILDVYKRQNHVTSLHLQQIRIKLAVLIVRIDRRVSLLCVVKQLFLYAGAYLRFALDIDFPARQLCREPDVLPFPPDCKGQLAVRYNRRCGFILFINKYAERLSGTQTCLLYTSRCV